MKIIKIVVIALILLAIVLVVFLIRSSAQNANLPTRKESQIQIQDKAKDIDTSKNRTSPGVTDYKG